MSYYYNYPLDIRCLLDKTTSELGLEWWNSHLKSCKTAVFHRHCKKSASLTTSWDWISISALTAADTRCDSDPLTAFWLSQLVGNTPRLTWYKPGLFPQPPLRCITWKRKAHYSVGKQSVCATFLSIIFLHFLLLFFREKAYILCLYFYNFFIGRFMPKVWKNMMY